MRANVLLAFFAGLLAALPSRADESLAQAAQNPVADLISVPIQHNADTDINLFTWQYFVNYNFSDGWYFTSAPIMTADWEADSDDRWTVPVGAGFGNIFRIGKQPMNFNVQGFYYVEAPEVLGDWALRAQLQFMFPK